jgi:hypothetical protein
MDESDIEFYETGAPPPIVAGPRRVGQPTPRRLPIPVAVGLIAVALIVVAPFQHLYGIRTPDGSGSQTATSWIDGWGRSSGGGGSGVRWGQGLYLGAGLVLLAALAGPIGRRWLGRPPRLVAGGLALTGSGVLIGMVVAEWLTMLSTRSILAGAASVPFTIDPPSTGTTGSGGYSSVVTYTASTGPVPSVFAGVGVWLAAAGGVLSVATALLAVVRRSTASPSALPLGSAPSADTDPPGTTGSADDDDTD